jgi:ABC-type transporter Mla subunit MlaD
VVTALILAAFTIVAIAAMVLTVVWMADISADLEKRDEE